MDRAAQRAFRDKLTTILTGNPDHWLSKLLIDPSTGKLWPSSVAGASNPEYRKGLEEYLQKNPGHWAAKGLIDPETGKLRPLVANEDGVFHMPTVDAGHMHPGTGDQAQLSAELSLDNRTGGKFENRLSFATKPAVSIQVGAEQVPVNADLVAAAEKQGLAPAGTLAGAPESMGWSPSADLLEDSVYERLQPRLKGTPGERYSALQKVVRDWRLGNPPSESAVNAARAAQEANQRAGATAEARAALAKGQRAIGAGTTERDLAKMRAGARAGEGGFGEIGGILFALILVGSAVYVYNTAEDKVSALEDIGFSILDLAGWAGADYLAAEELGWARGAVSFWGLVASLPFVPLSDTGTKPEEQRDLAVERFLQDLGADEDDFSPFEYAELKEQAYRLLFQTEPLVVTPGEFRDAGSDFNSSFVDSRGEIHGANLSTPSGPAYRDDQGVIHGANFNLGEAMLVSEHAGGQLGALPYDAGRPGDPGTSRPHDANGDHQKTATSDRQGKPDDPHPGTHETGDQALGAGKAHAADKPDDAGKPHEGDRPHDPHKQQSADKPHGHADTEPHIENAHGTIKKQDTEKPHETQKPHETAKPRHDDTKHDTEKRDAAAEPHAVDKPHAAGNPHAVKQDHGNHTGSAPHAGKHGHGSSTLTAHANKHQHLSSTAVTHPAERQGSASAPIQDREPEKTPPLSTPGKVPETTPVTPEEAKHYSVTHMTPTGVTYGDGESDRKTRHDYWTIEKDGGTIANAHSSTEPKLNVTKAGDQIRIQVTVSKDGWVGDYRNHPGIEIVGVPIEGAETKDPPATDAKPAEHTPTGTNDSTKAPLVMLAALIPASSTDRGHAGAGKPTENGAPGAGTTKDPHGGATPLVPYQSHMPQPDAGVHWVTPEELASNNGHTTPAHEEKDAGPTAEGSKPAEPAASKVPFDSSAHHKDSPNTPPLGEQQSGGPSAAAHSPDSSASRGGANQGPNHQAGHHGNMPAHVEHGPTSTNAQASQPDFKYNPGQDQKGHPGDGHDSSGANAKTGGQRHAPTSTNSNNSNNQNHANDTAANKAATVHVADMYDWHATDAHGS